jgi:hypothetical protein
MTKKTKDWWVSQAHKYGREVGELRDLLSKESLKCAEYRYQADFNQRVAKAEAAKTLRCADMLEALVLALEPHEGHDELVKDARIYLNLLVNGQEYVKPFEHYHAWRDR